MGYNGKKGVRLTSGIPQCNEDVSGETGVFKCKWLVVAWECVFGGLAAGRVEECDGAHVDPLISSQRAAEKYTDRVGVDKADSY